MNFEDMKTSLSAVGLDLVLSLLVLLLHRLPEAIIVWATVSVCSSSGDEFYKR